MLYMCVPVHVLYMCVPVHVLYMCVPVHVLYMFVPVHVLYVPQLRSWYTCYMYPSYARRRQVQVERIHENELNGPCDAVEVHRLFDELPVGSGGWEWFRASLPFHR